MGNLDKFDFGGLIKNAGKISKKHIQKDKVEGKVLIETHNRFDDKMGVSEDNSAKKELLARVTLIETELHRLKEQINNL